MDDTKLRARIRNRLSPAPGTRREYRRTIYNVINEFGEAQWLNEVLTIFYSAYGFATFPDDPDASMVAYEVTADGREIGWVRIDPLTRIPLSSDELEGS